MSSKALAAPPARALGLSQMCLLMARHEVYEGGDGGKERCILVHFLLLKESLYSGSI